MPPTDSPTWWADVQQDRADLEDRGRRSADDWLGEEIDFVPRRRITRGRAASDLVALERGDRDLHGVFIPTAPHAPVRAVPAAPASRVIELGDADDAGHSRVIELGDADDAGHSRVIELRRSAAPVPAPAAAPAGVARELRHLHVADDPFVTPPPPPGARRTIHITGRPNEHRLPSMALRHRPRTTSERIGPRPDRIAMWAVILGLLLIILAFLTS